LAPLASILSVIALWIYRGQIVRAVEGTRTLIQFGGKDPDATAPAAQAPVPASPPVMATIR